MRRLILLSIFSFGAVVVVACGGKSSPPPQTAGSAAETTPPPAEATPPAPGDKGEEILAKLREYEAAVCACKDAACIQAAQQPIMVWADANEEALKNFQPTKAQEEEVARIERDAGACEDKIVGPPASSTSVTSAEILAKMEEYKTKICACKDKACVEKVQLELSEWANANMNAMMQLKPTKEEDARADKIQTELNACVEKVRGKP